MSDALVFLNGINALTGQYLVPPLTPPEAAVLARQTQLPREKANLLERLVSLLTGALLRIARRRRGGRTVTGRLGDRVAPDTPD